jgi:hypothetical protein
MHDRRPIAKKAHRRSNHGRLRPNQAQTRHPVPLDSLLVAVLLRAHCVISYRLYGKLDGLRYAYQLSDSLLGMTSNSR